MPPFSTTNTQEADEREAYIEALNKSADSNFSKIKIIEFVTLILISSQLMFASALALESYLKENQEVFATWNK
ncbi:hypothetical protein [Agrobacterium tumefaciens]|uniref:Uncharacterized protein n=1 Tax=Agrobacterium tumefaciens TaxID=358 RepID=A0A2L2LC86_AGRTU|nr:hypothetical protein [Agrobacterium tumefaciens]AVH41866.1 hypothetical protein At1D1609_18120 [Agrobacterium tumefaciens]NSY95785.1 hypothetical protein [Agrobacterium tumefaciens]